MKKIVSMILSLILVFSCVSVMTVSADSGTFRTYGADNLNNQSGDLVIGFLGGSITEGAHATAIENRWSTKVVNEYFKVKYPNKNVIERNASIGGTGSAYGMIRMRKDLALDSASTPDVVFVEFAVNDAGGGGMTISNQMESIVRQLLALPKIPVIVFVYTTSKKSLNGEGTASSCVENAIAADHAVAENYGIYEVDLNEYVWEGVKDGKWTWIVRDSKSITDDGTHPNNAGYKVYADRIVELFNRDKSKVFKKLDPDTPPYCDYVYGEIEEVPFTGDRVQLSGNWQKQTYSLIDMGSYKDSKYPQRFFREGYMKVEDGTSATIEFEFTGRAIGIDFVRNRNNADLQYTIYDEKGTAVKNGTTKMYYSADWDRCCGHMLVRDLPYGKYKIVAKGVLNAQAVKDNSKRSDRGGTGLQLNMGYFVVEKTMPKINPYASDVKITNAVIGKKITGSYKFNCKLYDEKDSEKAIYVSDSENGQFTKLADGTSYTVKPEDLGKYIKFGVTPKNTEGVSGKTVYSAATKVVRPTGELSFASPVSVKVNGADAAKPGVGTNAFSGSLANSGSSNVTVNVVAATYKTVGEYKYLTGSKVVSKAIEGGKTADFTVEITAAESDTEIVLYAICADSMEPVIASAAPVEYVGTDDEGGIATTIYRINSFIK